MFIFKKITLTAVALIAIPVYGQQIEENFYLAQHQLDLHKVALVHTFTTTTPETSWGYSGQGGFQTNTTARKHVTAETIYVDVETALYFGCSCGNLDLIEYTLHYLPKKRLGKYSREYLLNVFEVRAPSHPAISTALIGIFGAAVTLNGAFNESEYLRVTRHYGETHIRRASNIRSQKILLYAGTAITTIIAALNYWQQNQLYKRGLAIRTAISCLKD